MSNYCAVDVSGVEFRTDNWLLGGPVFGNRILRVTFSYLEILRVDGVGEYVDRLGEAWWRCHGLLVKEVLG